MRSARSAKWSVLILLAIMVLALAGCGTNSDELGTSANLPPAPEIAVQDSQAPPDDLSIPFGSVQNGTTASKTIFVANEGKASLVLGAVGTPAAPFTVTLDTCSSLTLTTGMTCMITVSFTPTSATTFNSTLTITSNDSDEGTTTVALGGTGSITPVPDITVTESSAPTSDLIASFGTVYLSAVANITVTVKNDGTAALTLGTIAAPASPYSITSDTCSGATLAAAASCTLTVSFAPVAETSYLKSITITSDDPDEPSVLVWLSGAGTPDPAAPKNTTTVSGKVTLSSTVAGKPSAIEMMAAAPKGKPGTKSYKPAIKDPGAYSKDMFLAPSSAFSYAIVKLYDADHPAWLYPVAYTIADPLGNYTLSLLSGAELNGNAYTDRDPIPSGNYTLIATGQDPSTFETIVAVQFVVNNFEGDVTGVDLEAQPNDVSPRVVTMFGKTRNTDGTQTWGNASTVLAPNASVQVTFSMAMARDTMQNGIIIDPAVTGKWAVSPDWISATFYPDTSVQFAPGTYTVTVQADDTSDPSATRVRNVYGTPIPLEAVGTFTVISNTPDAAAPTVTWAGPLSSQPGPYDVTVPIRIASDEVLDVNRLLLTAVPSLGDKPGVIFVGQNAGNYIYEFVLSKPLALDTPYTMTISGGRDLSGNTMSDITKSITTKDAASVGGINPASDSTTQNAQAEVLNIFGKWVRAMNDRSITQFFGVMGGNFILEYDAAFTGISAEDINRDGKLDVKEFEYRMLGAFNIWDFCGTTIQGTLPPDKYVNIVGDTADFEFKLLGASTTKSKDCDKVTPDTPFFVTLKKTNGAWTVVRISEGIDTRGKQLVQPALIKLLSPEDGAKLSTTPSLVSGVVSNPVTFNWNKLDGEVSSYVLIWADYRDPSKGMAIMLPATEASLTLPVTVTSGKLDLPNGYANVSDKFGFMPVSELVKSGVAIVQNGGEVYWEVLALKSTTVNDVLNGRAGKLFADINGISRLYRYRNPGTFQELQVKVLDSMSNEVKYSELVMGGGYDAGSEATVTLRITTSNASATGGYVDVVGHTYSSYPLDFAGTATKDVVVNLNQGWNWVWISDGKNLTREFNIQTTGGTPPVLTVTRVLDDSSNILNSDSWGFYDAPGAKKVTVQGAYSDPDIGDINVNVWNESGASYYVTATVYPLTQTYEATVDIYPGANWIDIDTYSIMTYETYLAYIGVQTDTGTAFVPPVRVTDVQTATVMENYLTGSNWDATADSDNSVTVIGTMNNKGSGDKFVNGHYEVISEGAYEEGSVLVNAGDGSFRLNVKLYNGWNFVYFLDCDPYATSESCWSTGNWYDLGIYTENGEISVKPVIETINGQPYDNSGYFITDQCTVAFTGTALPGDMEIYWDGFDGSIYYSESRHFGADGSGNFTVTLPIVGGVGNNNYYDLFDALWNWVGVSISTTANCTYTPPSMSVDQVLDASGAPITPDTYGDYDAGASNTVTISGTDSDPSRQIAATLYTCGGMSTTTTTVDGTGAWSLANYNVYDGFNWIDITDGYNAESVSIVTQNGNIPPTPLNVTAVSNATFDPYWSGCGWSAWALTNTTVTSITITGTTTAPDGQGEYDLNSSSSGTFTITDGTFSFTVNIDATLQNYISIFDTLYNYHSVDVYPSEGGGTGGSNIVTITSPMQDDTVSGTVTVTGTVDLAQFVPFYVDLYITDYDAGGLKTIYSTDYPAWGDFPLTYDSMAGTFSQDVSITAGNSTEIWVDIGDMDYTVSHGNYIYVNNNWGDLDGSYKPSVKKTENPYKDKAHTIKKIKSKAQKRAKR